MALFKKKDKEPKPKKNEEEAKESFSSKLVLVFVTILIILIWLGIIAIMIKFDVGGFGSTILRPLIKDVPYLNMILPKDDEVPVDTQYSYESIDDAVARIKELEQMLDAELVKNSENAEVIDGLQAQIIELSVYKEEQDEFERNKELFYEEIVFSEEAPGIEAYKAYYESIDPENAEVLYKQVVEQISYNEEVEEYAKTYSTMKPKEAAAIFDTMTDDLQLVADILLNMSTQSRADILGKMDSELAAKLTAIMEP